MTQPQPEPTPCPDCGQPIHAAVDPGGNERRLTADPHLLGIWVLTAPGHARKATAMEIRENGRTRTARYLHHCPPARPEPAQPGLF
jgi:hypothetical protein